MPTCEKCWADSRGRELSTGDPNAYFSVLNERTAAGRECTPEEQAGPDAAECPKCKRMTAHQHCHVCMACGFDPDAEKKGGPES